MTSLPDYSIRLPSWTIGIHALDKVSEVCRESGTRAVIIGGRRAMAAIAAKIEEAVRPVLEITDRIWYGGEAAEENIAMLDLIRESLRITPNELYGVIDDVIGYTALTDRNVVGAESAPAPFYSNPVSQWKKISGLANRDLRAYILKYYGQE